MDDYVVSLNLCRLIINAGWLGSHKSTTEKSNLLVSLASEDTDYNGPNQEKEGNEQAGCQQTPKENREGESTDGDGGGHRELLLLLLKL